MRILVMGAGAVGGYFGGLLARDGNDVTFVARGAHLATLLERGLEIRAGSETVRINPIKAVRSPEEARGDFDVALFTVKAYDAAGAAEALRPAVGPKTAVLTLQNGVDSVDVLSATLGAEHVLAGATTVIATVAEPGVVGWTPPIKRITFGEPTGGISPRVEAIHAALVRAGIEGIARPNALIAVWEKFVLLSTHATITSACGSPVGPIRNTPEGAALYRAMIQEVVEVARAEGIDLPSDITPRTEDFLLRTIPDSARSSMEIGFDRKQRVELEYITGAVIRRARQRGIPTPRFDALYAVLKVRAMRDGLI